MDDLHDIVSIFALSGVRVDQQGVVIVDVTFQRKGLPPPYATSCGESKLKHQTHYSAQACLLELLMDHVSIYCGCKGKATVIVSKKLQKWNIY